jgi:hypothetical protein
MSTNISRNPSADSRSLLSLDVWAVIVAFTLALAVKLDILKNVPW